MPNYFHGLDDLYYFKVSRLIVTFSFYYIFTKKYNRFDIVSSKRLVLNILPNRMYFTSKAKLL